MRILIIRRDNIGDLVCTTPLLAALRERYPDAHIAALVNSYNAAVLDGNPDVDAIHVYTKLKHRLPGESRIRIIVQKLGTLARLRSAPFDYVVLAKAGFDRQGLGLARRLRRRHVVGYVSTASDDAAVDIKVPIPDKDLHEVEVMQGLGQAIGLERADGALRLYPDQRRVEAWRARLPAKRSLRIAVHISARVPSRRWTIERWAAFIQRLASEEGADMVLLWSPGPADHPQHPGDDATAAAILKATNAIGAPTRDLPDLISLLALCDAFIGADGGAMHLAAALRLPIVAFFDNLESHARRWHPWRVPHELVVPDTQRMADVTVEQVLAAWTRLRPAACTR